MPNVKIRKLQLEDAPVLANLANNLKIWLHLRDRFPHPYTHADAEQFIGFCVAEEPQLTFAIEVGGAFAGCIGLVVQHDVYRHSAEVGYWLGEPFWGKGIASEALRLVCDFAFEKLGLLRLHSGVFEGNLASMRVLEKAGFECEGIFKKGVLKNGRLLDEHRFGKVKNVVEL